MVLRRLLGLFLLPLGGCATVGGIRTAPLDAGTAHFFRQPLPVVAAAARTAVDSVHLTFDTAFAPDSQSLMLVAHHGINLMSYGELVRILMRAHPDGGTFVHVYTQARLATDVMHTSYDDPVFRELARALGRTERDSNAARLSPVAGTAWAPQGAALVSLGAGATIRIRTHDGALVTGSVAAVSDSLLSLQTGSAAHAIPAFSIDSLWTSHGHARTGMIIGSFAGFAAALGVAQSQCPLYSAGSCTTISELQAVGIIAGGALVGALLGSAVRTWQIRYP